MIKRTLNTYDVTAVQLDFKNGEAVAEELGKVTLVGTTFSSVDARKAFKANGIDLPRGCKFDAKVVHSALYGISTEDFIKAAKVLSGVDPE